MRPVLFTLPGLGWELQAYGVLLALALLAGWLTTLSLGRRDHLPPGPLGAAYVIGAGLGLIAARLGWLLQRPGDSGASAELVALRGDELAPFAGILVAALLGGLHLMRRRVPVVAGYDVAAPAFALGAMLERVGALLAGTGFGDYAPELSWAIRFPGGSPAWLEHRRTLEALLPAGADQSLPVHPTQVYGLLLAGATLAVALWLRRRRTFSGQVLLGTGIAYLVGRALVEDWFRADAGPAVIGPFNSGQLGALVLVAAMGVVLWSRSRLAAARPDAYRPWMGGRWSPGEMGRAARKAEAAAASQPAARDAAASRSRGAAVSGAGATSPGKGRSKGAGRTSPGTGRSKGTGRGKGKGKGGKKRRKKR